MNIFSIYDRSFTYYQYIIQLRTLCGQYLQQIKNKRCNISRSGFESVSLVVLLKVSKSSYSSRPIWFSSVRRVENGSRIMTVRSGSLVRNSLYGQRFFFLLFVGVVYTPPARRVAHGPVEYINFLPERKKIEKENRSVRKKMGKPKTKNTQSV